MNEKHSKRNNVGEGDIFIDTHTLFSPKILVDRVSIVYDIV